MFGKNRPKRTPAARLAVDAAAATSRPRANSAAIPRITDRTNQPASTGAGTWKATRATPTTTATDRIAAAAHPIMSAPSSVSGRTGVTPRRRRMPRSRYWPITIGTPFRPRMASTIATPMDAMYWVPIWPDRLFCGSPNPGISPNPMTSATGIPNTPIAAPVSRRNSLVSTKASLLKPFMSPSPSAFHALAGQRHVGAVQAASLAPQVGYQHLPAGEFGGDSAGKVAGAGDGDLRIVAAHHRDAGQRGQRLLVKRRHRPEPHPVLTPGGVHQTRPGVFSREIPP